MDNELPILDEIRVPPNDCPYLPGEQQSLTYRVMLTIQRQQYVELLRRGWRRHGMHFFRPTCPNCVHCRSLRLPLAQFRASKSQRRTLAKNRDVSFSVHELRVDAEHIELFNRYHEDMHQRRQWPQRHTTASEYFESFMMGDWPFAMEMEFRRGGQLIGVSMLDISAESGSSIYFYYDPAWRPAGPGTFSMLCEIEYLHSVGVDYHYLGYWIQDCQSMAYKARFGPHELLQAYVDDDDDPVWTSAAASLLDDDVA